MWARGGCFSSRSASSSAHGSLSLSISLVRLRRSAHTCSSANRSGLGGSAAPVSLRNLEWISTGQPRHSLRRAHSQRLAATRSAAVLLSSSPAASLRPSGVHTVSNNDTRAASSSHAPAANQQQQQQQAPPLPQQQQQQQQQQRRRESAALADKRRDQYKRQQHRQRERNAATSLVDFMSSLPQRRVTAYCGGDRYQMDSLMTYLTQNSRTPMMPSEDTVLVDNYDGKQVFIFESGTLVSWGAETQQEEMEVVEELQQFCRKSSSSASSEIELEEMQFVQISDPSHVGLYSGVISVLDPVAAATAAAAAAESVSNSASGGAGANSAVLSFDAALALSRLDRLTCSHALAKSAMLWALETRLEEHLDASRSVPADLESSGSSKLTPMEINKSLGVVLGARAYLNLHSGLLDAPEITWDHARMEALYNRLTSHLDIRGRSERVNRRLDYSKEMFDLLRQTAAERHSSWLEKIIIVLIFTEIVFNALPVAKWLQASLGLL